MYVYVFMYLYVYVCVCVSMKALNSFGFWLDFENKRTPLEHHKQQTSQTFSESVKKGKRTNNKNIELISRQSIILFN